MSGEIHPTCVADIAVGAKDMAGRIQGKLRVILKNHEAPPPFGQNIGRFEPN